MFLRTEIPNHSPNSGQKKHEANHAPNDRPASRTIADQFFVRPVLRVGNILTGAIGAGGPGRPPEERGHLPLFRWVAQSPRGNCV